MVGLIIILALALNWNKAQIVSSRFSYSDSFYAKTYLTNNVTFFDTEYLPVWANYFGILDHKGVAWDGSASSPFFQSKTEIQVKDFQKPSASSLSRVYRETQGINYCLSLPACRQAGRRLNFNYTCLFFHP